MVSEAMRQRIIKELIMCMMTVTKVNITLNSGCDDVKATAEVLLNGQFVIRGLWIVPKTLENGDEGVGVKYPHDPYYKGAGTIDIYRPITRELESHIEKCVLDAYRRVSEA